MEEAGFLHYKFLCRDHFLPTDFMTLEGICLGGASEETGHRWKKAGRRLEGGILSHT